MISLSAIARKEKNELSTDSAFIVLLDIRLGEETVRICYNTEDVTWNGNLYQTDISWVRESSGSYAVYVMEGNSYKLVAEGVWGNSYSYTSVKMPSKVKVVTIGVGARSPGTVANVTLITSIVINKVTGLTATVEHQDNKYNVSVQWNATDAAGFRYYEVSFQGEVYRASGTSMDINDAETGTFVLAVTVVTYYGRSEEKTVSVTIGGTASCPDCEP